MENLQPNKSAATEFLTKVDTTLLAWLVFLALGGGLMSLYYAHIGYLPDIEWSSSIVHLATATFIGGGFALLFALSLFIPGCLWSAFLLFDERLRDAFCYHKDTDEVCVLTLWWSIGFPFSVIVLLNHFALLACEEVFKNYLSYAYAGASAVLLVVAGFWINRTLSELQARKKPTEANLGLDEPHRRAFKYTVWFLVSILVSQISMLLIHLFSGRPSGRTYLITTAFCIFGVMISNHFVAIHYRRNRLQAVLVSLVIAALLLLVADRNSSLSPQVMAFYGVGDMSASVDLVLNDEGIKAVEQLKILSHCQEQANDRLCDVQVLSKLGDEYFLKADGRTFTLPKSAVRSRLSK